MLYFDTLPKTFMPDQYGNPILVTNIMTRARLIEQMENNPMLFYKYSIQDGDTPEIVAEKYYDDPYRYWIIMYSNQALDPLWDWPMNYEQFLTYLDGKYAVEAADANQTPFEYTQSTIYDYQKLTTTRDNTTGIETTVTTSLTFADYMSLIESSETFTLPNTETCTITVTKTSITVYDYEYQLNEGRREIKIMNNNFAGQFEQQFDKLMNGRV